MHHNLQADLTEGKTFTVLKCFEYLQIKVHFGVFMSVRLLNWLRPNLEGLFPRTANFNLISKYSSRLVTNTTGLSLQAHRFHSCFRLSNFCLPFFLRDHPSNECYTPTQWCAPPVNFCSELYAKISSLQDCHSLIGSSLSNYSQT